MGVLYKRFLNKIEITVRRVGFDGFFITLIATLLFLLINSNTLRVIQNGQKNYNIYSAESESLETLEERNRNLQKELEVVSTDEYQKLLAREILGLVEPNETIFNVKEDTDFFILEKTYIDVKEKEDYSNWWMAMIL